MLQCVATCEIMWEYRTCSYGHSIGISWWLSTADPESGSNHLPSYETVRTGDAPMSLSWEQEIWSVDLSGNAELWGKTTCVTLSKGPVVARSSSSLWPLAGKVRSEVCISKNWQELSSERRGSNPSSECMTLCCVLSLAGTSGVTNGHILEPSNGKLELSCQRDIWDATLLGDPGLVVEVSEKGWKGVNFPLSLLT